MTYISRKTRLLMPRWFDECDPAYLYHLNRKRSDGRLKRHGSCDDLRAWVDDQYLNYQYLLELVTDGEFQERPLLGIMGRIIPVENILELLCGGTLDDGEQYDEMVGSRLGKLGPEPRDVEGSDATVNAVTTNDILNITNAAMLKLENIGNLIHCTGDSEKNRSFDEKNDLSLQLSGDISKSEELLSENNGNREEYLAEYNKILRKISSLRQKLGAINKRKEELRSKVQSSRQAMCRSSSGMTITELYSREEQMIAKWVQEKIVKLTREKGNVLNEMCEAMKNLKELKKKLDSGTELSGRKQEFYPGKESCKKMRKCPCTYEKNENGLRREIDESTTNFSRRKKRDIEDSDLEMVLRKGSSQENSVAKYPQHQMNGSGSIYPHNVKQDEDSSVAVSASGAPNPEFLDTQEVSEMIGDKKSKSESPANDLEQMLRGYKQQLSELGCIEVQIEDLKKRASMASYFKKRWLRCTTRDTIQKRDERTRMKMEMKQLHVENNDLRKLIVTLTAQSEKEQNEIHYLKCKHKQLLEMEEEMMELKKDLKEYQISFETQRDRIESLESTVTMQRDKIENLMTHIRRLKGVTQTSEQNGKICKKYIPRSRSHGPENKMNLKKIVVASSEESLQNTSCCYCCSCTHHFEPSNRPRSECTRRMILIPQTWRRQFCNN